jgi:hypothetical protein
MAKTLVRIEQANSTSSYNACQSMPDVFFWLFQAEKWAHAFTNGCHPAFTFAPNQVNFRNVVLYQK